MVIYEVNVNIDEAIYSVYYSWLQDHVREMLNFPGFLKADIGLIERQEADKDKKLRISYFITSADHLNNYLQLHAPRMRAEAMEKFGNQFSATRRIMWEVNEIKM